MRVSQYITLKHTLIGPAILCQTATLTRSLWMGLKETFCLKYNIKISTIINIKITRFITYLKLSYRGRTPQINP